MQFTGLYLPKQLVKPWPVLMALGEMLFTRRCAGLLEPDTGLIKQHRDSDASHTCNIASRHFTTHRRFRRVLEHT
jgi:hypothetical protein